ncbi:MAG: hypothetical protein B6I36_03195 [Desulfobacteraceae bacterium 4572_35.1]|nr:MAG: hypothetical protein B6I36_03195 [Desulfobacteraceae bacterium 4572_35.1]
MKFCLCVLGVLFVLEGIPWFLSPQAFKRMLLQVLPLPENMLRIMGFVLMVTGLATVYFAVNYNWKF